MRVLRGVASFGLAVVLAWALVVYGAAERQNLYLFMILLAALAVIAVWSQRAGHLIRLLFLPVLVVGAFCLVQVFRLPPLQQEGYVLPIVWWVGLALALLTGWEDRARRRLVLLLIALGLLEAFYGLVQSIGQWITASGTYGNRNHFGGLLNMTIPLAIGALSARYPRKAHKTRSGV